eukprot:347854_1
MGQILNNNGLDETQNMENDKYNLSSVDASEYANKKWTTDISWQSLSETLEELIDKSIYKIQHINKKNNIFYLDIGSGPGNITNVIVEYFDYFMTIEPNPFYYKNYKHNVFKDANNKYLGNTNTFLQNIDFDKEFKNMKFNLITCIHTFYYIELKDYSIVLNKLYKLLNDNGGQLIISMAPKHKDKTSNWSQIMCEFIGKYFDSLEMILSICSKFDGVKIEIFDEKACFDNTYVSIDDAIDKMLWNIMEELSFARKYNEKVKNKTIASELLRGYLSKNCVQNTTGECVVTATVGHIVITKLIDT